MNDDTVSLLELAAKRETKLKAALAAVLAYADALATSTRAALISTEVAADLQALINDELNQP